MKNDIQIHRTFVHTRIAFKNSEIEGRMNYIYRYFVKKYFNGASVARRIFDALKKAEKLEKFTSEKSVIGTGELFAALFIITNDN